MAIPFEQKVIAVLFSLSLVLLTLHLIRKHRLREDYAFVWFGASLAIFAFSVFDRLNVFLAQLLGVTYPPTLMLVFGLLFCLVLLLSQAVMLSGQANRIRDLAQCVAMMECRIKQLEQAQAGAIQTKFPTIVIGHDTVEPAIDATVGEEESVHG